MIGSVGVKNNTMGERNRTKKKQRQRNFVFQFFFTFAVYFLTQTFTKLATFSIIVGFLGDSYNNSIAV